MSSAPVLPLAVRPLDLSFSPASRELLPSSNQHSFLVLPSPPSSVTSMGSHHITSGGMAPVQLAPMYSGLPGLSPAATAPPVFSTPFPGNHHHHGYSPFLPTIHPGFSPVGYPPYQPMYQFGSLAPHLFSSNGVPFVSQPLPFTPHLTTRPSHASPFNMGDVNHSLPDEVLTSSRGRGRRGGHTTGRGGTTRGGASGSGRGRGRGGKKVDYPISLAPAMTFDPPVIDLTSDDSRQPQQQALQPAPPPPYSNASSTRGRPASGRGSRGGRGARGGGGGGRGEAASALKFANAPSDFHQPISPQAFGGNGFIQAGNSSTSRREYYEKPGPTKRPKLAPVRSSHLPHTHTHTHQILRWISFVFRIRQNLWMMLMATSLSNSALIFHNVSVHSNLVLFFFFFFPPHSKLFFISFLFFFQDKIIRLLGEGTFGKVLECADSMSGTKVAVKVIKSIQKVCFTSSSLFLFMMMTPFALVAFFLTQYRDAAMCEINIFDSLKKGDPNNNKYHPPSFHPQTLVKLSFTIPFSV